MEKERLLLTIGRYDQYYDSVNNKGNIILGFSTVILASLLTVYPMLQNQVEFNILMYVLLILSSTLGFLAMLALLISAIPFTKSNSNSLLFFQSITSMSKAEFFKKSKEQTEEEELEDLKNQVYDLADGLKRKFNSLKRAIQFIVIQMILLVPLIILILTHFKSGTNGNL